MADSSGARMFTSFKSELETVANRSDAPVPASPDPPGGRIAAFLVEELKSRGIAARPERPFEDYCRMIDCERDGIGFEIRVGFVGDEPQQWLVMIDSTLTWIGRLLGRTDAEASRRVATAVDEALREEAARSSEIRWYTVRDWDAGGRNWAEHPVELAARP